MEEEGKQRTGGGGWEVRGRSSGGGGLPDHTPRLRSLQRKGARGRSVVVKRQWNVLKPLCSPNSLTEQSEGSNGRGWCGVRKQG